MRLRSVREYVKERDRSDLRTRRDRETVKEKAALKKLEVLERGTKWNNTFTEKQ